MASGSPRRCAILRAHGIEPEIHIPEIDEEALVSSWLDEHSPEELTQQLALHKAQAVYELMRKSARDLPPDTLILAADTVVYKESLGILGKPAHHDDAVSMLQALCNASHNVITGVALISLYTGKTTSFADTTTVSFGTYSLEDIEAYIATEPPYDKAGSYAIQGYWARYVESVEGDWENVIGLPFCRLESLLT